MTLPRRRPISKANESMVPPCAIEGLAAGGTVRGVLESEVKPKPSILSPFARSRSPEGRYLVIVVAALLGIWLYLALSMSARSAVAAVSEPAVGPQSRATTPTTPVSASAPSDAVMAAGRSLYVEHCASCHQTTGAGVPGAFPPLADNDRLANADFVIDTVLRGRSGPIVVRGQPYNGQMPALGAQLSDSEIASVVTYVRNSFGNHFGSVDASQVKARR